MSDQEDKNADNSSLISELLSALKPSPCTCDSAGVGDSVEVATIATLFGATQTTLSADFVEELSGVLNGHTAEDMLYSVANSCRVEVKVSQNCDSNVYTLSGQWANLAKLGCLLLQMTQSSGLQTTNTEGAMPTKASTGSETDRSRLIVPMEQDGSDSVTESKVTKTNKNHTVGKYVREVGKLESVPKTEGKTSRRKAAKKSLRKITQSIEEENRVDLDDGHDGSESDMAEDWRTEDEESNYHTESDNPISTEDIEDMIEEAELTTPPQADLLSIKKREITIDPNSKHYKCKMCVFSSSERPCVKQHIIRQHMKSSGSKKHVVKKFSCPECSKTFLKRHDLSRHMSVHTEYKHKCLECGKGFKSLSNMQAHMETHKEGYLKPKYDCSLCEKSYTTKYVLENHVKVAHKGEVKKWQCDLCGSEFTQKGSMLTHQKVVHGGEKPFKCQDCTDTFKCSKSLAQHRKVVHDILPKNDNPEEEHKCTMCFFVTTKKEYLKDHIRRNHHEKNLVCAICDARFCYNTGLKRHMRNHVGVYQCTVCNKVYKDARALERHIKTHDPNYVNKEQVQCEVCHKTLFNKYVLAIHHRKEHTADPNIFQCTECGRAFKNKQSLDEHIMMHKGLRPWVCKVCGKDFTYRTSLRSHMRVHLTENKHMCETCGKSFKCMNSLRVHSIIHSDPYKHKCPHCGKGFSQKQALNRHIRTHTSEKPYACSLCSDKFNDSSILRRHVIGVHKVPYTSKHKRGDQVSPKVASARLQGGGENLQTPYLPYESNKAETQPTDVSTNSHGLSMLAGLCTSADHVTSETYAAMPVQTTAENAYTANHEQNTYNHNAMDATQAPSLYDAPEPYNLIPPESPSMPALIPVTLPSQEHLNTPPQVSVGRVPVPDFKNPLQDI